MGMPSCSSSTQSLPSTSLSPELLPNETKLITDIETKTNELLKLIPPPQQDKPTSRVRCISCLKLPLQTIKNIFHRVFQTCFSHAYSVDSILTWANHFIKFFNKELQKEEQSALRRYLEQKNLKQVGLLLKAILGDIKSLPSPHKTYAEETLEYFTGPCSMDELSKFIIKDQKLTSALRLARTIKQQIKELKKLKSPEEILTPTIKKIQALFKKTSSVVFDKAADTHFGSMVDWSHQAALIGKLKRTYQRITELVESRPKQTRIASLFCSHGGGHKSMIQASTPYLEEPSTPTLNRSFTVRSLDLPNATRPYMDPVYQAVTKLKGYVPPCISSALPSALISLLSHKIVSACFSHPYSTLITATISFLSLKIISPLKSIVTESDAPRLMNWLLQTDRCKTYMWIKKTGMGSISQDQIMRYSSIIKRPLLQTGADLIHACYTFDHQYIIPAASTLGLPVIHTHTDLDNSDWVAPTTGHHFRMLTQSKSQATISKTRGTIVPDEQVVEIGLAVGREMETAYTQQELTAYKRFLNIQDDRPIVVFTSGANGTKSPLPSLLVTQYKDTSKPIALIVVTGNNTKFKEFLDKKILPVAEKNPAVQLIILGFQNKNDMAKLYHISSCVVGKPGGLTTMEVLKTGARFIADRTKPRFPWEIYNSNIITELGKGCHIEKNEEIFDAIQKQIEISSKPQPPVDFALHRAGDRMYQAFIDVLSEAEKDALFMKEKKQWHTFATKLAECAQ